MKSARVQGIFQRVCGRCEQIYANMRHFPSELARSKRSFHCAISPARHDTVNVRQSVGFVSMQGQNAGGTAEILVFPSQFSKRELGLFLSV